MDYEGVLTVKWLERVGIMTVKFELFRILSLGCSGCRGLSYVTGVPINIKIIPSYTMTILVRGF